MPGVMESPDSGSPQTPDSHESAEARSDGGDTCSFQPHRQSQTWCQVRDARLSMLVIAVKFVMYRVGGGDSFLEYAKPGRYTLERT